MQISDITSTSESTNWDPRRSMAAELISTKLINSIGEPNFSNLALSHINSLFPVSSWSVYQLRLNSTPTMLLSATCGRPDVTEACWREYRRNLYLDDRSFDSAREISSTGSLALAHMTAADLPSEHRKAIYERYMLKERLSIVISESREEVLAVNFYRYSGESSFTDGETASISRIAPYLIAAIKRNASIKSKTPKSENSSVSVDSLIRNHCPELTDREIQVCAYMVQGLTFDGIAASLNLSPATVKTYRDRAFQRMGIHHRNELFGICIALVDGKHIR